MATCHRLSPANKLDCPHAMGTNAFYHSGQSHFVTFCCYHRSIRLLRCAQSLRAGSVCLPRTQAGESSSHPWSGALAHIKGFPYYGSMNITFSLDDNLVKEVRKIAVERDTTLTGLVRAHLQELAAEHAKSGRKRRELEALRESFEKYQFNLGKRTWKREDLHERR